MFSSNIYQVCAWYILLRTRYAGVYIAPRYQQQYVGARRHFYGGCVWRRLAFRHHFFFNCFFPGFAAPIKMCSCSWGSLWKSVKSSYRQTSVYMAGICSTQTEGYIPGIYQVYIASPPRYKPYHLGQEPEKFLDWFISYLWITMNNYGL